MGKTKWIQGAVHEKKVGSFRKYAKQHGGMSKGIQAGLKSHNPKTQHRAQFAKAMRSIAKKHH